MTDHDACVSDDTSAGWLRQGLGLAGEAVALMYIVTGHVLDRLAPRLAAITPSQRRRSAEPAQAPPVPRDD